MELTKKEKDLIATIRNYRNTYPKSKHLEDYINFLLAELMEEEENK